MVAVRPWISCMDDSDPPLIQVRSTSPSGLPWLNARPAVHQCTTTPPKVSCRSWLLTDPISNHHPHNPHDLTSLLLNLLLLISSNGGLVQLALTPLTWVPCPDTNPSSRCSRALLRRLRQHGSFARPAGTCPSTGKYVQKPPISSPSATRRNAPRKSRCSRFAGLVSMPRSCSRIFLSCPMQWVVRFDSARAGVP